jgi:uncharacterized protein with ACT and thioredoxin-like domain
LVEAELTRLTRDTATTQGVYNQLKAQLDRELLVNEGDDRGVVNFEIIDPPAAGVNPVAPRRTLMLFGVLVLALGGGAALAYVLNMLKPSFADVAELRAVSGLPVVGGIAFAENGRARFARRAGALVFAGTALMLVMLGGLTIILSDYGVVAIQQLLA